MRRVACFFVVTCAGLAFLAAPAAWGRPTKKGAAAKPAPVSAPGKAAVAGTVPDKPVKPKDNAAAPKDDVAIVPRGPTRIDFDDRLIQGQTNKSGAVYLFDRKELSIRSMVQQRTSFRDQIVKDIIAE